MDGTDQKNGLTSKVPMLSMGSEDETKEFIESEDESETPDHVLMKLGGCGKFQTLLCFLIQLMKMVVCWGMIGNTFFAFVPNWRCASFGSSTENNVTYPMTPGNASMTLSVTYSENVTSTTEAPYWDQKCEDANGDKCMSFEFEPGINTLVTTFNLVCDLSWVTATVTSVQMAGMCFGSIVVGPLGDRIGRKIPFVASMGLMFVFHLVCYFATSWTMYAVARFVIGIASAFFLSIYCTMQSEFLLSSWRAIVISFPSWAVESSLFSLAAFLLKDWQHLTLCMALMGLLFCASWFFIPESFRWLLSVDRYRDARTVVNKVARWNGEPKPDFDRLRMTIETLQVKETSNFSFVNLFKDIALLKLTMPLLVCWLTMGLVAYGVNFGIKRLSGDIYLNLFIFSVASIPSKFVSIVLQNKIGRKFASNFAFFIMMLGGVAVAIVQNIDTPMREAITNYCSLAASAGVDGAWGPMQTMSVEVYPTLVRNTGFGFLSTLGRLGAVIGPQLVYFSEYVPGLLYIAVAGTSFLSILCVLLLPETRGLVLLDKIEEDLNLHRTKEQA